MSYDHRTCRMIIGHVLLSWDMSYDHTTYAPRHEKVLPSVVNHVRCSLKDSATQHAKTCVMHSSGLKATSDLGAWPANMGHQNPHNPTDRMLSLADITKNRIATSLKVNEQLLYPLHWHTGITALQGKPLHIASYHKRNSITKPRSHPLSAVHPVRLGRAIAFAVRSADQLCWTRPPPASVNFVWRNTDWSVVFTFTVLA